MSSLEQLKASLIEMMMQWGNVTRPECQSHLGVRPASLLEAIDALKAQGVIWEPERQGRRTGRRAPQLSLAPDYFWLVGVEFRCHYIRGGVMDMTGRVLHSVTFTDGPRSCEADCWGEINKVINHLKVCCGDDWHRVRGIAFADPGLVDIRTGRSIRAVNIPGWRNVMTRDILEREYGITAGVWPECSAGTFMEYLKRGRDLQGGLFYMGMDIGIGGGYIKDGCCFFGDGNLAMEVGHLVVKPDGPLCQCGNRGCLEAIAGKNGIYRRVQETLQSGVNTSLTLNDFSLARFTQCARTDKAAMLIAAEICESLGTALATVVTLLNPTHIILHGELTGLGDFLRDNVMRVLQTNCFPGSLENLHLEFSSLEDYDIVRGVAFMLRKSLLEKDFGH